MEITEGEFQSYENVRSRGRFNMFDPRARQATGLSKEKYLYIIENYSDLMNKYPDVRN